MLRDGTCRVSGRTKAKAKSRRNPNVVPRVQKGLRHFSLKVCEKVEQLKITTYNKVADDLVVELTGPGGLQFAGEKVRGPDFNLGLANAFLCRC